ncbi:hypothetical protein [Variovorax sp. YR216]|uniref:hypothetical protein n=1 Tax=Variovorax sp. YR216 TaxID=1882828 RepID=UPI00115FDE10|nr:hypothetical protein [Variovorax sp. YR216]
MTTHEVLELHVAELRQLFNSMDPAPFRERDLDPAAEAYIVDWAREIKGSRPLALRVHVDNGAARPEDAAMLREAVDQYFRQREKATRRRLSQLFRVGRISLLIGLVFLGAALAVSEAAGVLFHKERYAKLVQESLVIGGWVALWRPMEIFLYDWWPIRSEVRLYERLGSIDVSLLPRVAEGRTVP